MRAEFCFVTQWAIKLAPCSSHATAKVIWSALDAEFLFFSMGAFFVDHWQGFACTIFFACIASLTQRMLTCPVWHFITFYTVPNRFMHQYSLTYSQRLCLMRSASLQSAAIKHATSTAQNRNKNTIHSHQNTSW